MIEAAESIIKSLEIEGVDVVFGYPGAMIMPLYEKLCESKIRHVLMRSETAAGHAASGYARMKGTAGVCFATSGPGAVNLIQPLATAYADSIPIIAFTGQVAVRDIGTDAFQEADITGAAEPFVKYSYLVKDAKDLPHIIKEAFYIAKSGRNGPVLIDLPVDVQRELIEFNYPESIAVRTYKPTVKANMMQIKRIAAALEAAQKPLIIAGGGIFGGGAVNEFRQFIKKAGFPVVTTMMGLGLLPEHDPKSLGMIGLYGKKSANLAVKNADLLCLIGARVGDRAVRAEDFQSHDKTIIHIDVDPAEIGKNIKTDIPLVGECKYILNELTEIITKKCDFIPPKTLPQPKEDFTDFAVFLNPKRLINAISEVCGENTVVAADAGQNQIWAARNFTVKNGRFIVSGGMGTMGYSIPAAIGVSIAEPLREIFVFCGDGSFQMMMGELAVIRNEKLPLKIILMNNSRLGMVYEAQKEINGSFTDLSGGNPDFIKIAEAYGIDSMRISDNDDIKRAVEFLSSGGAKLLECIISEEETTK
ncbi:MAG: biosynthetic-type acetolactate synthase large subunit [Ruminococcus sp.]|jgi:acetolactate synthase-1/2/3 large subunit|nr:biosynthetic-type acetolactate synthase large subunit [Ruminococcus sp.]